MQNKSVVNQNSKSADVPAAAIENLPEVIARSRILKINFPAPGERMRKVVTRSRMRVTGKHPSWKVGRMVQWESSHEHNAFRVLDADPHVRTYSEQGCEIVYSLGDAIHRHYPDLVIYRSSRVELWEVKEEGDASNPETALRTGVLQALLPAQGFHYSAALSMELKSQPRLANAKKLIRLGHRPVPLIARELIRRALIGKGSALWAELGGSFEYRRHVARLILEGVLDFDRDTLLTECTPVFSNEALRQEAA